MQNQNLKKKCLFVCLFVRSFACLFACFLVMMVGHLYIQFKAWFMKSQSLSCISYSMTWILRCASSIFFAALVFWQPNGNSSGIKWVVWKMPKALGYKWPRNIKSVVDFWKFKWLLGRLEYWCLRSREATENCIYSFALWHTHTRLSWVQNIASKV